VHGIQNWSVKFEVAFYSLKELKEHPGAKENVSKFDLVSQAHFPRARVTIQ